MKLKKRLAEIMETAVERQEVPCLSLMLLEEGKEKLFLTAGKDLAEGWEPERDTIFRLYSMSKPITAAAAAILIERGMLDALDPVSKYLPGFAGPKVIGPDGSLTPARREITMMDLLSMTAGLSYPGEDPAAHAVAELFDRDTEEIRAGGGMDTMTLMNELGKLPLAFEPGTEFRYSTCADVLGAVVEAVSGKRFGEFLREEIFEPLEMEDTAFWVPEEKRDRFVSCAEHTEKGLVPFTSMHLCVGDYSREPAFESGGAGLVSTLQDYARFATMLLQGGELDGNQVLKPGTVAWLTQPQLTCDVPWDNLGGFSYGKLMRVCVGPGRVAGIARRGEYGWDGWLGTYFANLPDLDMTILVAMNLTNAGTAPVTRRLRNAILAECP